MTRLKIIVGSTRPTRAAERVFPWVADQATRHGFDVEVLDLRDWNLPFFQEHLGTIGDFADPTYSDPVVRAWNAKVAEGDAFIIVTAEYNHSVPGQLKNAIDNVFVSFALRNKPVAFVGYSAGIAGGARAVEHLALIADRGRGGAAAQHGGDPVRCDGLRRGRRADQPGDRRRAVDHARRPRVVGERAVAGPRRGSAATGGVPLARRGRRRGRLTPRRGVDRQLRHSRLDAIRAPSASERSFAQAMRSSTCSTPATVPKPQSTPAMRLSRPTASA